MDPLKVASLYEKASKQLSMKGAFRARAGWTLRQVAKGHLHKDWIPMLQIMEDILEEFYPGHWDIHTHVDTNYSEKAYLGKNFKLKRTIRFEPVIHFEDIMLTNSKRIKQRLLDLFLKFTVTHMPDWGERIFQFGGMTGMRATLSDLEYTAGYNHSHFQGNAKEFSFTSCCTGSGEVNNLFALLSAKFEEDTFRLLMLQLKTYASWESLEGHPYKKIEGIIPKEKGVQSRIDTTEMMRYGDLILDHMKEKNIRLDWNLSGDIPRVATNTKFEEALKFLGNDLSAYDLETIGLVMTTDVNGRMEYYQSRIPSNSPRKKARKIKGFIPFRGKEFPFSVLPPEDPLEPGKQKVYTNFFINASIKQYVIGKLETRAARLADPVRNGVLRHLKGETSTTVGVHAEGQVSLW